MGRQREGHGDQENALKSVAMGAYDFYQKPVDIDTLQLLVERAFSISELEGENRRLQNVVSESPLDGIIAASEGMLSVCRMIEKVAPTDVTTLLLGESALDGALAGVVRGEGQLLVALILPQQATQVRDATANVLGRIVAVGLSGE